MSGASLGNLYVTLSAETAGFLRGMSGVAKSVEQTIAHLRKVAGAAASAGRALMGIGTGLVIAAAKWDTGVRTAMTGVTNAFASVAVESGRMLIPALNSVAGVLKTVADYIAGMTPAQREQAATIAKWAAAFAVATSAIAVALPLLQALAAAASAFFGVLATIGLTGMVVLAAIAVGVAVLRKAWVENWGGIQEAVASALTAIADYWTKFKAWILDLFADVLRGYVVMVERMVGFLITAFEKLGKISPAEAMGLRMGVSVASAAAKADPVGLAGNGLQLVYEKLKDGVAEVGTQWKAMIGDMAEWAKQYLPNFEKGNSVEINTDPTQVDMGVGRSYQGEALNHLAEAAEQSARMMRAVAEAGRIEAEWLAGGAFRPALMDLATAMGKAGTAAHKFVEGMEQAIGGAVKKLASKLGDAGDVINAALEGFQSGGIWGAVIAVIVEVFTKLSFFGKLVDSINTFFGHSLDRFSKALSPLFDAIINICEAIGGLIDIFMMLSRSVEITNGIFRVIGAVINFAALGIMMTVNNILSIIIDIGKALGANMTAAMKTQADLLVKAGKMVQDLKQFDLFDSGDEKVKPIELTTEKIGYMGEVVDKVSDKFEELLTNIPSGYKRLRAAQFAADGGGGPGYIGGTYSGATDAEIAARQAEHDSRRGPALGSDNINNEEGGGSVLVVYGDVNVEMSSGSLRDLAKKVTANQQTVAKQQGRNKVP